MNGIKSKRNGFTLIEMMITVAIVGILAAIVFPSYMTSIRKSNRAEAKTEMVDIVQRLTACKTIYGVYNSASCPVYAQLTTAPSYIPTRGRGYYRVAISNNTATTFTLTATANLAPQTGDTTNSCNVLTLTHLSVAGPVACW